MRRSTGYLNMTRTQKIILTILVCATIGVCSGLTYFVGHDILTSEFTSLASSLQDTHITPIQPTSIPVWPTAAPTAEGANTTTASEAITFAQDFRYDPGQGKKLLDLLNILQAANQKLGNDIAIEGWQAEKQEDDRWLVVYSYREDTIPKTYEFLVDLDIEYIKASNEGGDTVLTFLQQDAQANEIRPTATPVTIFIGWAARDYFTNWEYHVPTDTQRLETIGHSGEKLSNENGFLVVPLVLHNIGKATKTLRSDYYARFVLKDSTGKAAGLTDRDHLKIPTRLFCHSQKLPEWTEKNIRVSQDDTITTALVFQLLPDTEPPYTLEITVYELNTPHRYNIELTAKKNTNAK